MATRKHAMFFLNAGSNIRDHYEFGKVLGSGTFSTVRLAVHKQTGRQVAIKVIDKFNIEVNEASLKTEVTILKSVSHPNIVNLYDVYENETKVYLVMELLTGGELFDRIVNVYPNGYSEKTASQLVTKIIKAIQYLNSKGIVHRDLKPENLLYEDERDDSDIKITDFGLAKIAKGEMLLKTACGTPNYVAPEVLLNEGYDSAVDMWSVGVILYILLCGFPPFYSESTPELFDQIISGRYDFPEEYWGKISPSAKDLINKLLQVDPSKRYTPEQALNHPWIKDAQNEAEMPQVIEELKKFNARRKFKVTVEAVMAATRLMRAVNIGGTAQQN
eukprot:GEZU01024076.1.p1 GENE.GEZU01024076.1~~GEZU01024076.1.p1  ORF type:complete len:331 (+),score=90.96 GEZU01024076.1:85-1077(+)